MKREAWNHPKIKLLARDLAVSLNEARGICCSLWMVAAINFPRGDVGRLDNAELAMAIDWTGDADQLVQTLLTRKLLDAVAPECGRLYVHDWHEHADDTVHYKLARANQTFANGAESRRKKTVTHNPSVGSDRQRQSPTVGDGLSSPSPSPSPSPSKRKNKPPLASLVAPQGAPSPQNAPDTKRQERKRATKTPPPADLVLNDAMREYAARQGVADPDAQFAQFVDSAHAHARVYADWSAAWRTWVRNVPKFAGHSAGPPATSGMDTIAESFQRSPKPLPGDPDDTPALRKALAYGTLRAH